MITRALHNVSISHVEEEDCMYSEDIWQKITFQAVTSQQIIR